MTEKRTAKRFIVKKIMFDGDCIVDTTDEGYYTTDKQDLENLCGVLNELHEENQLLKLQVETKLFSRRELLKENEQLKKQLKEEQSGTRPITLNTHISDEDFKRIELLLKKHLGDVE